MTGGLYVWKDGREVPDTMNVSMAARGRDVVQLDAGFGNASLGITEQVLGTDGTILARPQIRYLPEKMNSPGGEALTQDSDASAAHMKNFMETIREGKEVNCPVELGFRVSIACRMAVESYRQGERCAGTRREKRSSRRAQVLEWLRPYCSHSARDGEHPVASISSSKSRAKSSRLPRFEPGPNVLTIKCAPESRRFRGRPASCRRRIWRGQNDFSRKRDALPRRS